MARPVRNNEVAGKLRTLKDQLAEYKEELKTVHPTFKISKNGKRLSNINATIQKIEREIEELKKRDEK
jgi:septal ring factor EnvC (AmiA/AmiB activator)